MEIEEITKQISATCPGVDVVIASKQNDAPEISWGDVFFIYDPDRNLSAKQRFPFATIVTKDYTGFDEASNLNRSGIFRLNIGIGKTAFDELFREARRSHEDGLELASFDFTALDQIMPHPVYFTQSWVCILNPTDKSLPTISKLIQMAYEKSVRRQNATT